MNTVLITGCSSGYGLATALRFHDEGWNVLATMRSPREDVLPRSGRLHVLALDVTNPDSVAAAVESSGPVDVLVNNAGIGAVGAFEATSMDITRELFDTNTFGVMSMTQAVVPQMRERRSGGMPPMQYLLQWRVALAKDLLRTQHLSTAQVAGRVGYQSASAFTTAFTRLTGCSPTEFARRPDE